MPNKLHNNIRNDKSQNFCGFEINYMYTEMSLTIFPRITMRRSNIILSVTSQHDSQTTKSL